MRARTRSRLFVVGLLVLGLVTPGWNLALTTFGKSNPQNNNNNNNNDKQTAERIPARECATDQECSAIGGTSCLESIMRNDNKMRCLCGDYQEPRNGICENQYKGEMIAGLADKLAFGQEARVTCRNEPVQGAWKGRPLENMCVKVLCSSSDECTPGAHCTMSNITTLPGKRCFCMQGFEMKDNMTCSGSLCGFSVLSLLVSLLIAGSV